MSIRLSGLYIYPLKSCAPLSLAACEVQPRGLAGDRRWMAVDESGVFLTGRKHPRLVLIRAWQDADGLHLDAPGMAPQIVSIPVASTTPRIDVRVWRSQVAVLPAGTEADAWLSAYLGSACRLVYMDEETHRAIDPQFAQPGDEVSFADGYPLLLISRGSLDALNARLPQPVSMLRFRPNLVVDGVPPHAEDGWKRVRIGGVEFDAVKPCSRCIFTTVDPATAEVDPDGEPLRTLAGYRRGKEGVCFGQNLIPRGGGIIDRGALLHVLG